MDSDNGYPETGQESTGRDVLNEIAEETREDANAVLQPAVDNLLTPAEGDEDAIAEAYVTYLLRAAEFGALAESNLGRAGLLAPLPDDHQEVMHHAREALFSAASIHVSGPEPYTEHLVTDTRGLVDALEDLKDEDEEIATVPETVDTDDEPWLQESESSTGLVESALINTNLDAFDDLELTGEIETSPVSLGRVPIEVRVDAGGEIKVVAGVRLTADQTEAFARGLLEQAEAAREEEQRREAEDGGE